MEPHGDSSLCGDYVCIGNRRVCFRLHHCMSHASAVRLQQTASRRDLRLSRVLGDKFHSIDQKQRCTNTERMIYVQQHLLDVYEHGTQIHDSECKRIYFQTCEIGEWTMRDLSTAMLNHGLPHMNHSQAYLSFFQNQNTRSRLITYAVHLPLVSLTLRNLSCDLRRGVVYPAFIFAQIFSAGQWGVSPLFPFSHICCALVQRLFFVTTLADESCNSCFWNGGFLSLQITTPFKERSSTCC